MQNNSKRIFRRLQKEIFVVFIRRLIGNHILGIPQSHVTFATSLFLKPLHEKFIQNQNGSLSWWTCV